MEKISRFRVLSYPLFQTSTEVLGKSPPCVRLSYFIIFFLIEKKKTIVVLVRLVI